MTNTKTDWNNEGFKTVIVILLFIILAVVIDTHRDLTHIATQLIQK